MRLTKDKIKTITQGALDIIETDSYIRFVRFTEPECAVIDNPNLYYPAGVQLELKTDGTSLRLCGRTLKKTGVRSYYAIDIYENDRYIGSIANLKDGDAVGNYACSVYPLGEFSHEFELSTGEKIIRIVLPHSVLAEISELTIAGATYVTPIRREKRLVVYGDSITQGYDALHPSNTYAMRLAEALGAELYNKGLGGACFCPDLAAAPSGVQADAVLIAYGTNDWSCYDQTTLMDNAAVFFEKLTQQYNNAPIFAITPIWRNDFQEKITPFGEFTDLGTVIDEVCQSYTNVYVLDGMTLVPHIETYFGDLFLHPNDAGFAEYAVHLIENISKMKNLAHWAE